MNRKKRDAPSARDEVEALAGIRRGLDDVAHGRTRPARQAIEAIRRRRNIPRKP